MNADKGTVTAAETRCATSVEGEHLMEGCESLFLKMNWETPEWEGMGMF
jgi:hypothetical protein